MKEIVLAIAKVAFYLYAFLWTIKPKIANSMSDVLELFYLDFLKVDRRKIEVVRLAEANSSRGAKTHAQSSGSLNS
jgi:hypothetical protein